MVSPLFPSSLFSQGPNQAAQGRPLPNSRDSLNSEGRTAIHLQLGPMASASRGLVSVGAPPAQGTGQLRCLI